MPQESTEVATLGDAEPKLLKLNIGCGFKDDGTPLDIPGYINIDRKLGSEAYPLAYPDNSVDEIRASHVLEHFGQREVDPVLRDWYRALKPGGILKIAVPDFAELCKAHVNGTFYEVILPITFGGQTDADDYHKMGFDKPTLMHHLWGAGFRRLRGWESDIPDCAKNLAHFSLNIMGYKPASERTTFENVGACLAAPRFGPVLFFKQLIDVLYELKMPMRIIQGCFWNQHLCEAMEQQLADGKEYILTFDYDTVARAEDVRELYRLLDMNPEADAVCALQQKRGCSEVLFGFDAPMQASTDMFSGPMTEVKTGHFGCTLFRAESLKTFARPWMLAQPGKDGRFGHDFGAVDPDINFWNRWRDAGKKLFLANHVAIGHMQEVITFPDKGMQPIHMKLDDYLKNGKPAGVWE